MEKFWLLTNDLKCLPWNTYINVLRMMLARCFCKILLHLGDFGLNHLIHPNVIILIKVLCGSLPMPRQPLSDICAWLGHGLAMVKPAGDPVGFLILPCLCGVVCGACANTNVLIVV